MDRFAQWAVCAFYSLVILPVIVSVTVSLDNFKFCDNYPYYVLEGDEEVVIVARSNQSTFSIIDKITSLEVSYCNVDISPKRSSEKQFIQARFEKLDIEDCKVKITIRETTPSKNVVNTLSRVACGDPIPDASMTTRAGNTLSVALNKGVDRSEKYDFKIVVSLSEGPDTGGLSFAVKLVIGISCALVLVVILVLVIKTIRYKRKVKKEEEDDEDIPETLPMQPTTAETQHIENDENLETTKNNQDMNGCNHNMSPPPTYSELYKYD